MLVLCISVVAPAATAAPVCYTGQGAACSGEDAHVLVACVLLLWWNWWRALALLCWMVQQLLQQMVLKQHRCTCTPATKAVVSPVLVDIEPGALNPLLLDCLSSMTHCRGS
jgi:hypothetical protein